MVTQVAVAPRQTPAEGVCLGTYRCPCPLKAGVTDRGDEYRCDRCGKGFPVIDGIPVFIDDDASVFAIHDYVRKEGYAGANYGSGSHGARAVYRHAVRWLSESGPSLDGFSPESAIGFVAKEVPNPRILVVGAGHQIYDAEYDVTYTDVAFGGKVSCICDAHGLPFPAERFDLVIAVAVLEHVADPYQCMAEIQRVLKPGGFVYSMVPFLQPVHMGAHDFTRFTPLGHRRLHRWFDEIASGLVQGPGTVLGLSIRYFLLSFGDGHRYRSVVRGIGLALTAPLRWVDLLVRKRKGAWDVAGATWFFGRMRTAPIPDREILAQYKGADSVS